MLSLLAVMEPSSFKQELAFDMLVLEMVAIFALATRLDTSRS